MTIRSLRIAPIVFACAFPACRAAIPPAGQPQQRTILLWEARAPAFQLVAPAGYRIDASMGPDFTVHYLLPAASHDREEGLGVYVGNYPGLLLPQRRDKPKVSTVAGTVAGQRVTWACWQEPPRRVVCETTSGLIPETSESVRTILHLWVKAASKKEAVTYRRLASTQIVPFR
jgi:hypothetical protein